MSGEKIHQGLVEQFVDPVFVVNSQCELITCNLAFEQHSVVTQGLAELLIKITPLVQGEQERIFWSSQDQHLILTVLPMTEQLWLIKCHPAQSTALSQRYHNVTTAIDELSEGMLICNATNHIELVNTPVHRLFPYIPLDSCQGMHILTFARRVLRHLEPNRPRRVAAVLRWVKLKIEHQQPCLLRFTNSDGSYLEYRDRITDNGERIGLIIDESSYRALHEQLELACEHATNLSQAKSSFMAAMSHEVKTPLNAIIGMLDLCLQDPAMAANEFLVRIERNADRLLHLINDVLDFTKFEAEKVELAIAPTNLRSLCEQLTESLSGQAVLSKTQISLYVDPALPQIVQIDDIRLSQIINNLLSNGLKFTTHGQPTLCLSVTKLASPNFIRFSVRDNGIGISTEQQRNIFNDFMQASPDIHRKFGGSGLGLSICQKICQLMGSVLQVESEVGKGSHFYFDLPAQFTGPTDLDRFDLSLAKDVKLLTNDPAFYALLARYAARFGFSCVLKDSLPHTLASREYVIYAPHFASGQSETPFDCPQRSAMLCDPQASSGYHECVKIQRSPLKLIELMTFIGATGQRQSAPGPGKTPPPLRETRALRALVVDDNPDNIFVLRKQLEAMDIHASFAAHPSEALIYFEQQNFDIIISDYQMPGMTGAELLETLREMERQQQRKVAVMVVLTADKTQHCLQDCIAAGANEVMMKPLTLKALASHLDLTNWAPQLSSSLSKIHAFRSQDSLDQDIPADFMFIEHDIPMSPGTKIKPGNQLTDFSVLGDCLGDSVMEQRREFLHQYAQNLLKNNHEMHLAVSHKRWNTLQRLAHNLQGSALIIGAASLSSKCEQLEELLDHQSQIPLILTLWQQTEDEIGQVYMELQTELRTNYA